MYEFGEDTNVWGKSAWLDRIAGISEKRGLKTLKFEE